MPNRIILEKVSLDQLEKDQVLLDEIEKNKINIDKEYEHLYNSIKENGFQPLSDNWPLHADNGFFRPQPFVLNKEEDIYKLPNGQHRYISAVLAGLTELNAYVRYVDYPIKKSKDYYVNFMNEYEGILKRTGRGMFQKLEFPYDLRMEERRDESDQIFHSTEWDVPYWIGKKVLDIAHNGGYFPMKAADYGASLSVGFEIDDFMYKKSLELRDVLDLNDKVILENCNFWDFNWEKYGKFDIVWCNQCIYHFGNGKRATDALERAASMTDNDLVMYTFIENEEHYFSDYRDGYRPTKEAIINDLHNLGFKRVRIYHAIPGAKYTVVASKKPEMYPIQWESDNLIYADWVSRLKYVDHEKFVLYRYEFENPENLIDEIVICR